MGHATVDHVFTFHCINDNNDRVYIALFSALQQTHCAFVRDGKGVNEVFFFYNALKKIYKKSVVVYLE